MLIHFPIETLSVIFIWSKLPPPFFKLGIIVLNKDNRNLTIGHPSVANFHIFL